MPVLKWRKGDPFGVLDWSYSHAGWAVMDPGTDGVALGWARPDWPALPVIMEPIHGYDGAVLAASRLVERGIWQLIIEDQYLGRSAGSALTTAKTAGFMQGAFAAAVRTNLDREPLIVVLHPNSWQASVLGGRATRAVRKQQAIDFAGKIWGDDSRWRSANAELRTAMADAVCMAHWWAGVNQ